MSVCVGHGAATATATAAEGAHYLALVGRGQNRPVEPIFDEAITFLPSALGLVTNCRWAWVVSCSWDNIDQDWRSGSKERGRFTRVILQI